MYTIIAIAVINILWACLAAYINNSWADYIVRLENEYKKQLMRDCATALKIGGRLHGTKI